MKADSGAYFLGLRCDTLSLGSPKRITLMIDRQQASTYIKMMMTANGNRNYVGSPVARSGP